MYFTSKGTEYTFYLVELDGKARMDKLGIKMKHYTNKQVAKEWRDHIAKHIEACKHPKATKAILKLEEIYNDMLGV